MAAPVLLYDEPGLLEGLVLGPPVDNGRGGKSVSLLRGGEAPRVQLCKDSDPRLVVSSAPRAYDGERMHLALAAPAGGSLATLAARIDDFALEATARRVEDWFEKKLDAAALRPMLEPTLAGGAVRLKVVSSTARIWRACGDGVVRGSVEDLRAGAPCMPIVAVQGLWFLSRRFGVALALTDAVVFPSPTFPFRTALRPPAPSEPET